MSAQVHPLPTFTPACPHGDACLHCLAARLAATTTTPPPAPAPPVSEPRLVGVEEAARLLGVGRDTVYKLMGSGELPGVQVRGRRLWSVAAIDEYVARCEREALR